MRLWQVSLVFVVLAVMFGVLLRDGTGMVIAVLFLALAFAYSPLIYPRHTPAAVAQASGRPVVYWRPGCPFCLRLRLRLIGRARHASWVNIWKDPDGAAAVRAIADGNETVPTVVIGAAARVNPPPAEVRRQLQ